MSSDDTVVSELESIIDHGDSRPFFTFIKGTRIGQIVEITGNTLVVGRAPGCELVIEDAAISRRHFQLTRTGMDIFLEDLQSKNGTYVNGKKVARAKLVDGDKIQISQNTILELTFLDETKVHSEKQRYEMGVLDAVTNIYNKRYFLDRFQDEFAYARRNKKDLALIIFDLDFFKKLNDTHGHLAGDLVLQQVAQAIVSTIRSDDFFARYGGEEFVIVMRDARFDQAKELAERIRHRVELMEMPYNGEILKVTISCGLGFMNNEYKDYLDLIAKADQCLYRAKKQGRNRVCCPDLVPTSNTAS